MTQEKLKIAIIGANGKMGKLASTVIESMDNCIIVARVNRLDNLNEILKTTKPDIAIELTTHQSVLNNSRIIINNQVFPIIGASGLKQSDIQELAALCISNNVGGLVAPNFSLGMALICKFTKELRKYYDDFSIIEYHHAQKKDKPSGTARYTAELLGLAEEKVASIRSDGFVAKQQLYTFGAGERILIDHESFDRNSFAKGIVLGINKVMQLKHLVTGLENII